MDEAEIKRLIGLVADRTMRLDFSWDWPGGVALYGVCRAYEATGEARYIESVKAWVDEYLELGIPAFNVNVCAMGHCLISLHEATGEDRYLELADAQGRVHREGGPSLRRGRAPAYGQLEERLPRPGLGRHPLHGRLLPPPDGPQDWEQGLGRRRPQAVVLARGAPPGPGHQPLLPRLRRLAQRPYVGHLLGEGQRLGRLHDGAGPRPHHLHLPDVHADRRQPARPALGPRAAPVARGAVAHGPRRSRVLLRDLGLRGHRGGHRAPRLSPPRQVPGQSRRRHRRQYRRRRHRPERIGRGRRSCPTSNRTGRSRARGPRDGARA